ncbi:reverse transcriptase domain-containing protein [Tanacetum coccineum]|uniref:Reverse transcriptase domain-containing protein n=1 Tax=Tanacetum coccineum TaxID=301880 RepID=A0ABQ4ZKU3_9ASTR
MANPDDEPMWAADRVVAPTPSPTIAIPTTANEFVIKGSSNSDTNKIMARMDAMTIKMDAQYKELKSHTKCNHYGANHSTAYCNDDETPISYNPPTNHNNPQNDSETPINLDSDDENKESTPPPQPQTPKLKEAPTPKPFPPKLGGPRSFLIPCTFSKTFSCNALSNLGASINLMTYSLYAKLSLETLKPTKMSVRLADRSFQYPIGIAENMLVEVDKFTFPGDFVILEMEEDSKVPFILGRPFLHTANAVIRVKPKELNLKVS